MAANEAGCGRQESQQICTDAAIRSWYERRTKPRTEISCLQERLDMDDKSLSKLVQGAPSVFGMSVEENLEPKLSWLQERLDMDVESHSKFVTRSPSVLSYSIEENLEPKLAWLQEVKITLYSYTCDDTGCVILGTGRIPFHAHLAPRQAPWPECVPMTVSNQRGRQLIVMPLRKGPSLAMVTC
jgi:hypothetical protein